MYACLRRICTLACAGYVRLPAQDISKGKIPKIVATFVYASSQGQRTHSARTKIPQIVATFVDASSQGQRTHSARTNFVQTYIVLIFYLILPFSVFIWW